jgi:hypothetical protein
MVKRDPETPKKAPIEDLDITRRDAMRCGIGAASLLTISTTTLSDLIAHRNFDRWSGPVLLH